MTVATIQPTEPPATLYTVKSLAELFGVEQGTIRMWERTGRLPRGRRITSKVIRWKPEDIAPLLDQAGR